ncbi:hypothetical protein pdam_00025384, partial [Pocillopora damicornis]
MQKIFPRCLATTKQISCLPYFLLAQMQGSGGSQDQFSVVFVEITAEGSTFDNYQLKLIEIWGVVPGAKRSFIGVFQSFFYNIGVFLSLEPRSD